MNGSSRTIKTKLKFEKHMKDSKIHYLLTKRSVEDTVLPEAFS